MIEEFIQGDSLEDLILHQEIIPEEQFINYGMQICAVLDYLHHLSPYPILYQDLKPEHIILCGNQVKIIDFGIASFITVFGKNFQLYGTEGYAAPEALNGDTVTTASDIYSLGKVLEALARACTPDCSETLTHIIEKAADRIRIPDTRQPQILCLHCQNLPGEKSGQKRSYLPTVIQKEIFCVSLICTSHKKHSRDRQPFRCRCNIFQYPGKHTESQTYSLLLYTNGSF